MNRIGYLSAQYLVTHNDLVKFGVDMTQRSSQIPTASTKPQFVESLIGVFNLPQLVSMGNITNTIKIKRKKKLNSQNKLFEVLVDRETGFFIESEPDFLDIMKFDPTTFDDKKEVSIQNVGYWNTLNKYVKPKKSSYF